MPARAVVRLDHDSLVVRPLTPATWDLFAGLVERNGGLFGSCWCTWFHTLGKDAEAERHEIGNREYKRRRVEAGTAHAALVCRPVAPEPVAGVGPEVGGVEGEEAVAWATYGPPAELPNIHHRAQYDADRDAAGEEPPDLRIACIQTDKRFRRQGLGAAALRGAVDLIAASGGGVVEGYPHDVPPDKKVSSSFLYNTTRGTYEAAGFTLVRRKGKGNVTMRRVVEPS